MRNAEDTPASGFARAADAPGDSGTPRPGTPLPRRRPGENRPDWTAPGEAEALADAEALPYAARADGAPWGPAPEPPPPAAPGHGEPTRSRRRGSGPAPVRSEESAPRRRGPGPAPVRSGEPGPRSPGPGPVSARPGGPRRAGAAAPRRGPRPCRVPRGRPFCGRRTGPGPLPGGAGLHGGWHCVGLERITRRRRRRRGSRWRAARRRHRPACPAAERSGTARQPAAVR